MLGAAQNVKSILQECYGNADAVTDELIDYILKPGLQVGLPISAKHYCLSRRLQQGTMAGGETAMAGPG